MPPAADNPRLGTHYGWIVAGIALVILYGSFYPFYFNSNDDPRGPLGVLLDSGFQPSSRYDAVSNILLYIPLGFFAVYALRRSALTAVAAVTAAGFAMSLAVELAQFYFVGRFQELTDLSSNTAGMFLGAVAGAAARRRVSSPYLALILACWLGSRWYPATPPPAILALDLFRFFAAWLVVGLMLEALFGESRGRVALPCLLAASLASRALTVNFELAEIAGGAAAVLLWCGLLWRQRDRARIAAVLFVILIVLVALEPFHVSTPARDFGWAPFRSFIDAGNEAAIRSFFEKAFFYGGMIWLLVRAGLSAGVSVASGATLVFVLRYLEIYLPGRSAEITDAVLLLMLAAVMRFSSGPLEDS